MNVCIVALGKIGLPLAVQITTHGHRVFGVDIDPAVVDSIRRGQPPFPGEPGLAEGLRQAVSEQRLSVTTDTAAAVGEAEVVVILVPVMAPGGVPDFGVIDEATAEVASAVRPGTLVVYETTLPVGATRERFAPALAEKSGLTLGEDLFVAYAPERVSSGYVFVHLRCCPKVVGGVDEASAQRAVAFYEAVLDFDPRPDLPRPNGVWNLGSSEAAEFTKLAETVYRDVNIGLANEFALFADSRGIDIYPVIEAANSQPYSHIHRPGIYVGGHCIPVYPYFYLAGHQNALLPSTARQVNDAMPAYALEMLEKELGGLSGKRVVVLGVAYRGGVKASALSGVFPLVDGLRSRGAEPFAHDPLFSDAELKALGFAPYRFGEPCDAAVLQADHREYLDIAPVDMPGIRVLYDGRNWTSAKKWNGVRRLALGVGA